MTELRPQGESHELRQETTSPFRTLWRSWDLGIHDEPLVLSLLKYRQKKNRRIIDPQHFDSGVPNLISSKTNDGRHMPIIDLDFEHSYSKSIHPPKGYLSFPELGYRERKKLQQAFNKLGIGGNTLSGGSLVIAVPHHYVASSQAGHGHLYIDVPMSNFKFFLLMTALFRSKQIELGYYVWSLRRGGNFVRLEDVKKTKEESGYYTYGWFFKLKGAKK